MPQDAFVMKKAAYARHFFLFWSLVRMSVMDMMLSTMINSSNSKTLSDRTVTGSSNQRHGLFLGIAARNPNQIFCQCAFIYILAAANHKKQRIPGANAKC